jgi:hypothetical protein
MIYNVYVGGLFNRKLRMYVVTGFKCTLRGKKAVQIGQAQARSLGNSQPQTPSTSAKGLIDSQSPRGFQMREYLLPYSLASTLNFQRSLT